MGFATLLENYRQNGQEHQVNMMIDGNLNLSINKFEKISTDAAIIDHPGKTLEKASQENSAPVVSDTATMSKMAAYAG